MIAFIFWDVYIVADLKTPAISKDDYAENFFSL
jgi:hypothetical protein